MTESRFHFDDHLDYINAADLKQMARLWGGRSNANKAESAQVLRQGLGDPMKVRGTVNSLLAWERAALAILRHANKVASYDVLGTGLIATGLPLPGKSKNETLSPYELIQALFKRGLLMSAHAQSPTYFSEYSSHKVWSDVRLLEEASYIPVEPFELSVIATPEHAIARRPAVVALDTLGLVQAMEQAGGLQLTKNGSIRVAEIRKLRKALHWPETHLETDGFPLLDPATAWVYALVNSGLMTQRDDHLELRQAVITFADTPIPTQVSLLLYGMVKSTEWLEITPPSAWFDADGNHRTAGRMALLIGLTALPTDGRPFFSLDDFDEALYNRVGMHFSLDGSTRRPYYLRYDPDVKEEAKWRSQRRASWLKLERQWLEAALKGWLYFLGLVELACDGQHIIGFRLTELGRSVLHPELASPLPVVEIATPIDGNEPPWIVQPNFDVVVYLDRATPSQLAFLEQHAERQQAHQHTAHYLLTRQSVYRGLESGSSVENLLATLQAGMASELPQNVVIEIREWAALRERITVYRRASLIEYPTAKELHTDLHKGIKGVVVSERYLLLTDPAQVVAQLNGNTRIDYSLPLPKCLAASEDGELHIKGRHHDLLIAAQLDQWAERLDDRRWQITPQSVEKNIAANQRVDQLVRLLNERLSQKIPPLLELAVRSWAYGGRYTAEFAHITVLRCTTPFVFEAIATSSKLQPYFKGMIFPDILLVDTDKLEAFRQELAWLKLETTPDLTVQPILTHRWGR